MADNTRAALRLAGLALAHAAWSVEDGETLCTLAIVEVGEKEELIRYEADSIPESLDLAHQHLKDRLGDGGHAALVVDGYSTPAGGVRTDALLVELLGQGGRSLGTIIQPYQAAHRSRVPFFGRASGFAILDEMIVSDEIDVPDAARILIEAAREHPRAGRLFMLGRRSGPALN